AFRRLECSVESNTAKPGLWKWRDDDMDRGSGERGRRSPLPRILEGYAVQLSDQRVAVLGGFQPYGHGRALDRYLGRQGEGDARNVVGRPLSEAGQLVRAADGEGMGISEAHCEHFLEEATGPAQDWP